MGTAALSRAHALPAPLRDEVAPAAPVPSPVRGPLVAVCGLTGGAGASTLTYLLARHAARHLSGAVLACDPGGPTAGLATYARTESPHSLGAIANAVAANKALPGALSATAEGGLRVIARRPRLDAHVEPAGLTRVMGDARAAHELTVVDCGTAGSRAAQQAIREASHVVWILPASAGGIARGAELLSLVDGDSRRREIVVARASEGTRKPPLKALKELAAIRAAPLVLLPPVPDLAVKPAEEALEAAQLSLDTILMELRR